MFESEGDNKKAKKKGFFVVTIKIFMYFCKNKKLYQNFINEDIKIKTNRKRILNSLPLFTISDALLTKILKRNNLSEEDIITIKKYKKEEEQNIKNILKTNEITDIIHNYENEINNHNKIYLSLENIFYNKRNREC